MVAVIDLSHRKSGIDSTFIFSGEFLAFLCNGYPEHQFVFITNAQNRLSISPKENPKEVLLNDSDNPFVQLVQQRRLKREIAKLHPDVYLGSPRSIFSKQTNFSLFISSAEELKKARQKKRNSEVVFCTDSFSYHQLLALPLPQAKKVYYASPAPLSVYKQVDWEERERIKKELTDGCEYFLLLNPFIKEEPFVNLLKAFSFFKKRLQTSFKLVMAAGEDELPESLSKLMSTYKYKSDLLFAGGLSSPKKRASLAAASYAALQLDASHSSYLLPQDALACGVPVVRCSSAAQQEQEPFISTGAAAEDMARMLMLLYKDEQYRKQVIQKGTESLTLFTHPVNALLLMECLQYANGQTGSFS